MSGRSKFFIFLQSASLLLPGLTTGTKFGICRRGGPGVGLGQLARGQRVNWKDGNCVQPDRGS